MKILEAHIGSAGYGAKVVLQDVNIALNTGGITAVIGPNGAGKSTLLKVIVGQIKLKDGTVKYNGVDITNRGPVANIRDGLCFVPQGNRVFTELSVQDNIEIGGHILSAAERRTRTEDVLQWFPVLRERLSLSAGKLSGGEKQQLALARALMVKPKLLLLDEPSLGLSPAMLSKSFALLQDINRSSGITVLVVEQKVREILAIADEVYALKMGSVAFTGTPSEILHGDTLRNIFLA